MQTQPTTALSQSTDLRICGTNTALVASDGLGGIDIPRKQCSRPPCRSRAREQATGTCTLPERPHGEQMHRSPRAPWLNKEKEANTAVQARGVNPTTHLCPGVFSSSATKSARGVCVLFWLQADNPRRCLQTEWHTSTSHRSVPTEGFRSRALTFLPTPSGSSGHLWHRLSLFSRPALRARQTASGAYQVFGLQKTATRRAATPVARRNTVGARE